MYRLQIGAIGHVVARQILVPALVRLGGDGELRQRVGHDDVLTSQLSLECALGGRVPLLVIVSPLAVVPQRLQRVPTRILRVLQEYYM